MKKTKLILGLFVALMWTSCDEGVSATSSIDENNSSSVEVSSNEISSDAASSDAGEADTASSSSFSSSETGNTNSDETETSSSSSEEVSSDSEPVEEPVDECAGKTVASDEVCDSRDGQIYKTTTIDAQVWMAENLNFEADSGSYCYQDTESNCDTYGRLYTWEAALGDICPEGWHLPSDAEWETMASYIADQTGLTDKSGKSWSDLGTKLKSTETWTAVSGISSDDAYGFAGLAGGMRGTGGVYSNLTYSGSWWSSTKYEYSSDAYYRKLTFNYDRFDKRSADNALGFSVRCLQD